MINIKEFNNAVQYYNQNQEEIDSLIQNILKNSGKLLDNKALRILYRAGVMDDKGNITTIQS